LFGIVTAVVVIAALYFARVVFIPLALAILVAVVLTPAVSFLEKAKLGRGIAIFVVVAGVVGLAGLVGWTVLPQFADLTYQVPSYEKAIQDKVDTLKGSTTQRLGDASDSVNALEKDLSSSPAKAASGEVASRAPAPGSSPARPLSVQMVPAANPLESVAGLLGPVATGLIVLVFAVFILAGREDLRNRLIQLTSGGRLTLMTQAMAEAWSRINHYLFMQMLVNAFYGVATGIALHFLGVPKAALWGFSAGLLRYLPYIGWPTAALMPSALALAVFPGWTHAIITAGIFIVLEMILANGVEPLLYGAHVGLAPLAILVSAVFWALIWGFPGLLLATPMSVCLMVVGRYVPSLGFLNILLGNEQAMELPAQYYQRLLAGDESEARQILEACARQSSLEDLYSSVVIPALALSEEDGHRNDVDEETRSFINSSTREFAEELAAAYPVEPGEAAVSSERVQVVCIPARDEADEVVAMMLCQLLERHDVKAQSVATANVAEMLTQVAELRPETVCISALPPLAMNHTRALYGKLRTQFPDVAIVVCLWQMESDRDKSASLLKLGGRDRLFATLPEVLRHFSGKEIAVEAEVARL